MIKAKIRVVLFICTGLLFLFSFVQFFSLWMEYREGALAYQQAQTIYLTQAEELEMGKPDFRVDFDSLETINQDVNGWIWISDTVINYPILYNKQSNDIYLSTSYDGTSNRAGSIFIDYRNASDYSDDNTILYGHNMKNGTMFAALNQYRNQSFYDEHPYLYIMTPDGNRQYEIISMFQTDALSSVYTLQFETKEEKEIWLEQVLSNSVIFSPFQACVDDSFVTLSTCVSGNNERARFVLVARFASLEPISDSELYKN